MIRHCHVTKTSNQSMEGSQYFNLQINGEREVDYKGIRKVSVMESNIVVVDVVVSTDWIRILKLHNDLVCIDCIVWIHK